MDTAAAETALMSVRAIAEADDWRVVEATCRAGPEDRRYEEAHGWASVVAVMGGTFTYRAARGCALLTPGSLLLGNAGMCFECGHEHGRGDRCIAFQFAPALIEDIAGDLRGPASAHFGKVRIPPAETLLPAFSQVRALVRAPDTLRAEAVALGLAGTALALDRDERRVAEAVSIIGARHAEPLSIAGLARDVGLGRRRFASAFRHAVGVTPYNYILNVRLDAAARRLEEGQSCVLDVALDVGFGDLSEFTRRFRARFGRPPGQYRHGFRRMGGIRPRRPGAW
jgi:AraC family transcriptional regulator